LEMGSRVYGSVLYLFICDTGGIQETLGTS
jgi:hypothetical protein